jgi:hypothetical protein
MVHVSSGLASGIMDSAPTGSWKYCSSGQLKLSSRIKNKYEGTIFLCGYQATNMKAQKQSSGTIHGQFWVWDEVDPTNLSILFFKGFAIAPYLIILSHEIRVINFARYPVSPLSLSRSTLMYEPDFKTSHFRDTHMYILTKSVF